MKQNIQPTRQNRKQYRAPQLRAYGDVRDLTLQLSGENPFGMPGIDRNPGQRNP